MLNRTISHPAFYFTIVVVIGAIGLWQWGCMGFFYGMLFGVGIAIWRIYLAMREI
ncbi:MAG: hypothetical protein NXI22_25660 [bacterium]|nr:hypothetical protein [bacterium]